jgi:hypothetical protein
MKRTRPEHVSQPLGKNAPTLHITIGQLNREPVKRDPDVCSVPAGCSDPVVGSLASGEPRCEVHLKKAKALGYGVRRNG